MISRLKINYEIIRKVYICSLLNNWEMTNYKGKLIIIGGSVDKGSFSESPDDLKGILYFLKKEF